MMKKFIAIMLTSFVLCVVSLGQFIDPILQELLDGRYILLGTTNNVSGSILIDGSVAESKLFRPLSIDPLEVVGTALIQTTVFSGPNIAGTVSNLVIVGFYPASNPSNFVTQLGLNASNFATEVFVLGQGFLTNEVDPTVTGFSGTHTWYSATGAVPNAVTNEVVYSNGIVKVVRTNGVSL